MKYVAIDPGKQGSWALFDNYRLVEVFKMPSDPVILALKAQTLYNEGYHTVVIEKVHSRPGNSSASMWTFAEDFGRLKQVWDQINANVVLVTPQSWTKILGLKKDKTESKTQWKNRLKDVAQEMFPKEKVTLWKADSLLIGLAYEQRDRN